MTSPKPALRRALRAARRALAPGEHKRKSLLAARAVARLPAFRAGARISVYLPFDGEMNTSALIAAARVRGVTLYVPVVASRRHGRLRFCALTGALGGGTFGIQVPRRARRAVAPRWLNLMLIPLVGIDPEGRRLGMGGGFYDRALAFRRQRRIWRGPLLVGFAFDCQRVPSVDAQPWDLAVDALATESGMIPLCIANDLGRGRFDPVGVARERMNKT
jgi:5-formyltetrahydrofolate cyclo-ligase